MGILGGDGFSLPVVSETEVVDVKLNFTDKAISALKQNMNGDEGTHVSVSYTHLTLPTTPYV